MFNDQVLATRFQQKDATSISAIDVDDLVSFAAFLRTASINAVLAMERSYSASGPSNDATERTKARMVRAVLKENLSSFPNVILDSALLTDTCP